MKSCFLGIHGEGEFDVTVLGRVTRSTLSFSVYLLFIDENRASDGRTSNAVIVLLQGYSFFAGG